MKLINPIPKTHLILSAAFGLLLLIFSAGCETSGQTGALAGAGIGALAGQAIGGDTKGTLIGTAIGTGVGYVIGNEADKKAARERDRSQSRRARRQEPYQRSEPARSVEVGVLSGTRWQVVSLAPEDSAAPFTSKIMEFRPYGRVITTTTRPDGTVDVTDDRYRVVGSTLIMNRPDHIINAKFAIEGDEMIIDSDDVRMVLKRLRP
ncbi:MAG: glycine zipper 2TM domain-containing protein [Planctomycetes bacterium]|nr:glycine zipper 2TM domain-containing protein [Planctomycetota bacterium]MCH7603770.1 glycine zipper 2TM domain-containing protein [Planctomycetota bacterium]